jgi:uncharacterized protein YkwD
MKRCCAALFALAALALLPAGCPLGPGDDSARPPVSSGGGAGSSSINSVIPGQAGGGSAIAAGGNASAVAGISDGLTVEFPGCQEPAEAAYWRSEVLRLVNQERQSRRLGTLTRSATLEDQATQYACELIYYDFFDHVNQTTGSTLADRSAEFGYDYWIIGENLAAGQRSPAEVVADWMDSPCHRENLLNPAFTELGVGVRVGGDYGYYWVQEFGRPFTAAPYSGPDYHDPGCDRDQ